MPVGWPLALFGGQRGFTSGEVVVRAIGNGLHMDYSIIYRPDQATGRPHGPPGLCKGMVPISCVAEAGITGIKCGGAGSTEVKDPNSTATTGGSR